MERDRSAALLTAWAAEKLMDHFAQVLRCVELLSEAQLWFRPNESSNAVGNLLLHLNGNLHQWILAGLGGRALDRNRPAEFASRGPIAGRDLIAPLERTIGEALEVLGGMVGEDVTREYDIQGYRSTGVAAIAHVVEHFAFHTGQIITTTKWLVNVDLSLYDAEGHRLDRRRESAP